MMETQRTSLERRLPTWLLYTAIALLLLGIFFRLYNLDHKVYWLDEAYTSLRLAGYTKAEFVQNVFTGSIADLKTLQHYQHLNPDRGLADTLKSIAAEEPQITPLYFVLTRFWAEGFGNSVTVMRSLPALISLLSFPCLWWLCWELFQTSTIAWMAIAFFSLTPLHVLYAQEARPYSLWTVLILLSSAVLLWAIRTQTRLSWLLHAVTVALGLYTQLLFGLVAIAHCLYITLLYSPFPIPHFPFPTPHSQPNKQLFRKIFLPYLLATLAACLTLLPWLALLFGNLDEAQARTASTSEATSLFAVVNQWFVNNSRAFVGWDLGPANLILALGVFYALYFLYRTTPKRIWLFVLTLIGVVFIALALPDLLLGGERSTRIRYLIPCYLGIQMSLAHLFTQSLLGRKKRQQWSRTALILLLCVSLAACIVSSQARVWWSKSVPRSSYYLPVAKMINKAEKPLVIGDSHPIDLLAFSYWLDSDVKFQLINNPNSLKIADGFGSIFLLNPSEALRSVVTRQDYNLKLIYNDRNAPEEDEKRLWQVQHR